MLPVLSTDGQITTGLPMSLTQVSGGCLFLVQMVRLLLVEGLPVSLTQVSGGCLFLVQIVRLLLVVGLPVSLTQVSGNYLFLIQMDRLLLLTSRSANEPYTGEQGAACS